MVEAAGVEAASHQFFLMISGINFVHLQQTYNMNQHKPPFTQAGLRFNPLDVIVAWGIQSDLKRLQ
jgi:hypothetical protein